MNLGIIPLRNFGVVDEQKIYRSAQPIYRYEYRWLQNILDLKTIVNLRKESRIDEKYAPLYGITPIDIDIPDDHAPTIGDAQKFVDILSSNTGPILFHCEHGHGRTSTFNVITRLYQGWTLEEALKEEKEKFMFDLAAGTKHFTQLKFLEGIVIKDGKVTKN